MYGKGGSRQCVSGMLGAKPTAPLLVVFHSSRSFLNLPLACPLPCSEEIPWVLPFIGHAQIVYFLYNPKQSNGVAYGRWAVEPREVSKEPRPI
jgi:hypothetical protein